MQEPINLAGAGADNKGPAPAPAEVYIYSNIKNHIPSLFFKR